MKMYKKSELTLNHGMLVTKDGDIVLPGSDIVAQANALETLFQKFEYLDDQPEATPAPTLDGFVRKSERSKPTFEPSTPTLDRQAHEAMAMMNELDRVEKFAKANCALHEFEALLDFAANDFVVDCGDELAMFDTPMMGSILELTPKDVADVIALTCGLEVGELIPEDEEPVEVRHIKSVDLSDEEKDALMRIIVAHDEDVARAVAEEGDDTRGDEE